MPGPAAALAAAISPAERATAARQRLRVIIRGAVQGVGFRPFVFRLAQQLGLKGWVINSSAGVFIEAEADHATLEEFLNRLERDKPAISYIQSLESSYLDPVGFTTFEIRESEGGEKTALILPDLAICPDCRREIEDPSNRRFRYPFTNCTNCGPRFTIIASLPYDRPRTTMKKFTMCAACAREYHDPADRRFHAQPNACPDCGPQLALWDADGTVLAECDRAMLAAAEAIRDDQIVAVKGLGGFHLLVDARNELAVQRLRTRKRREEKPFALMFPTYEDLLRVCTVSEVEHRLLHAPESPIVLLRRRGGADNLALSIAPGNPYLGVMLPYTPLHHLLLAELGFPVVATSGNLSEEPICIDEHDALQRLQSIADLFLVHDRPILRHVDDSIVREMGGRELVIRRARGFAPLPVHLPCELPTLLAVGAHQKNTIAASVGQQVFVSQHIGDLETDASFGAFKEVISAFEGLYELKPQAIACDLHPDYMSTQFARRRPEPRLEVQHHYAHVLACMAENQLTAPVLGISWDGSGYGPDGTVWGGEILRVTCDGYERVAHLRPFLLPGNEKAVREPRRVALALLYEIFGERAFALDLPTTRAFATADLDIMSRLLQQRVNAPVTSSAGRLFDGFASLLDIRQLARFEGQAAMELEFALAGADDTRALPFDLRRNNGCYVLDWEAAVHAVLERHDISLAQAAARFHNMLVEMAIVVARRFGEPKVVLSGGCFQNRYLTERFITRLREEGMQPYWHQRIPPNDGGIALGQIVAAAQRRKD
jgi:hydrogenase maturation protein HypF